MRSAIICFIALPLIFASHGAIAQSVGNRQQLSEFLDKQSFPKTGLTESDILAMGLTSESVRSRPDGTFKVYQRPSLKGSTSSRAACSDQSSKGRFFGARAGDKLLTFDGGNRVVPRSVSKVITPSEEKPVDQNLIFRSLGAKFGRADQVPTTEKGEIVFARYDIIHHGFPVSVTFEANDTGCLLATVNYRRYTNESTPTDALSKALK